MKYAAEMGSGAMLIIASFVKIGSAIQKLMGGWGYTYRHRQQGDIISSILFFQNMESRLKVGIFVTAFPWFPTNHADKRCRLCSLSSCEANPFQFLPLLGFSFGAQFLPVEDYKSTATFTVSMSA
jgi:hypothetical protein